MTPRRPVRQGQRAFSTPSAFLPTGAPTRLCLAVESGFGGRFRVRSRTFRASTPDSTAKPGPDGQTSGGWEDAGRDDGRAGVPVPDPALVVLVGPSGSGKSTWAATQFRATEIVSSDALRAVVGSGPNDLDASADAFALLDTDRRRPAGRGLTTVVDTLGPGRRTTPGLARAGPRGRPARRRSSGSCTPAEVCRARNRARDRPVPAAVADRPGQGHAGRPGASSTPRAGT